MTVLKDLLLQYDANFLRDLAEEHGLETHGLLKNAVAGALAKRFSSREHVEPALKTLSDTEREVVSIITRAGGEVLAEQLDQLLVGRKLVSKSSPSRNPWERGERIGTPNYRTAKPRLEDVSARLLTRGLVFTRRRPDPYYKSVLTYQLGDYLVIPPEILAHLPAFLVAVATAPEPERVKAGSPRDLQRDLARYAAFVRRNGSLGLTTQGWVYKKLLTELLQSLGRSDIKKTDEKNEPYLYFLRRLLTALDLLRPDRGDGDRTPEPSALYPNVENDFWSLAASDRIQKCYQTYLSTTAWNELRVPAGAVGHDHRHPAPREMLQARRLILDFVKKRGASAWVGLSDLVDDIRLGAYEFLFSRKGDSRYTYRYDYRSPYDSLNNPYGISYRDIDNDSEAWDRVEGEIIRHVITGPLHWMGLVDLGLGEQNTPVAYRLNPVGNWLILGAPPVAVEENGGRVVVQPDFTIVAMEPVSQDVLMSLDEFARFEGGDHALSYRLSRESVYRGQRSGWNADRVLAYLEQATHAPLPQNIRRSLEEWQSQHERIVFHRGVPVLQTEDAAALDELMANPALTPRLGRRVSDTVALPTGDITALASALRDANWLLVSTRREDTSAPASVVADAGGNIEFVQRTPSIYAYAAVEPFAESVDARHARITPESIAAATERQTSVTILLDRLKRVHRGEIPAGLVTRIKAWGKYYGDARLGNLTLVEFRDEKARTELLADPELKPYLFRFDAGPHPLALVDPENVDRVKALLAARGVDVQEYRP